MRQNSFSQAVLNHRDTLSEFSTILFSADIPATGMLLTSRSYGRFPFVPGDPAKQDERCREV